MVFIMQAIEKDLGMSLKAFYKDGLWGVKNKETGEILCEAEYEYIEEFSYGYAVICKNGRRGFINTKCKRVFEKYCDVRRFINGFAAVKLFFDRWTFIDVEGNELTKKTYKEVGDFNAYNYASVCQDEKMCGFIDRRGEELSDGCVFESTEVTNDGRLLVNMGRHFE